MKLSVVILNYNVRYFLEQCIISVQRALRNIDSEIIVVDNNSGDDSCAMVRERFPEIRLIENSENLGFSKANNKAVQSALGEYVCILNPDTAVGEDTFMKALSYAESVEDIGGLGVKLIDGTGRFLPESKRNVPTLGISLSKLLGKRKNRYYARHLSETDSGEVAVLVGAFILLKRDHYTEVSGFDEDYFMYGEDIDLSYKILKAGYKNHYHGGLSVLHYKGESTTRDKAYMDRFYGAMKIFYRKHFKGNIALNMLVSIGLVGARWFRSANGKREKSRIRQPEQAMLLSDNLSLLQQLSARLELPLTTLSKSRLKEAVIENTMIIFDAEYLPYAHIFTAMEELKGHNNSFRIRPPGCNFILGSDHSDQKGSTIVF